ncbi:MAG TPA: hypothetical protein DHN29_08255 [Cytophagales bacterium]|nr:hypothetical protein [Cytophagales bacterium]
MKQLFTATLLCALVTVFAQKPAVQNQIKRLEQDIEALKFAPNEYRLLKAELQDEYLKLAEKNKLVVRQDLLIQQNMEVSDELLSISMDSVLIRKYVKTSDSFKDSVRIIFSFDNSKLVESETTYELRSGEWVMIKKFESFYDEDGHDIGWANYFIDSFGEFVGGSKYVFELEDGKVVSSENLRWDSSIQDWYLYSKNLSGYEGDNLVYQESWNWNWDLSECVPNYRYSFTYDSEGNRITQTTDDWSFDEEDWSPDAQYEFQYQDGRQWTSILSWWDDATEQYQLDSRMNTSYNSNGDVLAEYFYSYNEGEWVYTSNVVHWYTYDAANRVLEEVQEQSFDDGVTTRNVYKLEAAYTETGGKLLDAFYTWQNDEWTLQYKYIYTLNEEDESLGFEVYYTDWSTGLIVGSFKFLMTYGEDTQTTTYYAWDAENSVYYKNYSWEAHFVDDVVEYEDYYVFTNDVPSLDARKTYFRSPLFEQIEEIPTISVIAGTSSQLDLDTYFEVNKGRSVVYSVESLKSLVNPSVDGSLVTLTSGADAEGTDSVKVSIAVPGLAIEEAYIKVEVLKVLSAKEFGIEVYPNPTANFVSVSHQDFTSEANYQLFSLGGHLITYGKVAKVISLQGVQKGTYILRLEENGKSASYRIITQ